MATSTLIKHRAYSVSFQNNHVVKNASKAVKALYQTKLRRIWTISHVHDLAKLGCLGRGRLEGYVCLLDL